MKSTDLQHQILKNCDDNNIPHIDENAGELLSLMVAIAKPKRLLEIGTGGAYSTYFFSANQTHDLEIDTVELNDLNYQVSKKNISLFASPEKVHLFHSDALKWLKNTTQMYDFIFVDANKRDYHTYYELCLNLLHTGGIMVFDDVLFWHKDEKAMNKVKQKDILKILLEKRLKQYFVDFTKKLQADDRVHAFLIDIGNGFLTLTKK